VRGKLQSCTFYPTYVRPPANKQWQGISSNIPDLPVVVVVPVPLVQQVTSELHRYLQHGRFDLLPYLGQQSSRPGWFTEVWRKANNPEGRRIIITTPTVRSFPRSRHIVLTDCAQALQSDLDFFQIDNREPCTPPREIAMFRVRGQQVLFGHKFLVAAIDEAHTVRNINKSYWSAFLLRTRAQVCVAITATPVTTKPAVSFYIISHRTMSYGVTGLVEHGAMHWHQGIRLER
jgi:SNF2 family DNA or RNA helicase